MFFISKKNNTQSLDAPFSNNFYTMVHCGFMSRQHLGGKSSDDVHDDWPMDDERYITKDRQPTREYIGNRKRRCPKYRLPGKFGFEGYLILNTLKKVMAKLSTIFINSHFMNPSSHLRPLVCRLHKCLSKFVFIESF